jgi:hypothetical protein
MPENNLSPLKFKYMAKKKFNVLSPDGFSIDPFKKYKDRNEAIKEFMQWQKRYEKQGYYSSTNYGRIPLDQLHEYCQLIEI